MTIFDDFGDVISDIPIIGDVYDFAGNLLGGATGTSDIGQNPYQVPDFTPDPGAFLNPSTTGNPIPTQMTDEQKAYQDAKAEYNKMYAEYEHFFRQAHGRPPTQQDLVTGDWYNAERLLTFQNKIAEMDKQPEVFWPQEQQYEQSLRDQALDRAFAPDTGDWLMEGAQQPGQEAPQLDPYDPAYTGDTTIDRSILDPYSTLEGLGRQEQMNAVDLYADAAMGLAPSRAEIQMQQGLDQAIKNQQASANAARGGAGAMMRAQRLAADQGAAMQQAGVREQAALRAAEMEAARAGLMSGASQLRQSDMGRYLAAIGLGETEAGYRHSAGMQTNEMQNRRDMADLDAQLKQQGYDIQQRAQYLNAYLSNRGMDINERMGYLSNVLGVDQATLNANIAQQGMLQGQSQFVGGTEANIEAQNAAEQARRFDAFTGMAGSAVSAAAGGGGATPQGMSGGGGGGGPVAGPAGGWDWGQQANPSAGVGSPTFYGNGQQPTGLDDNMYDEKDIWGY